MKISNIEAIPISVPLVKPFKAAYGVRETADFVIVKVITDDGRVGLGEAATIPIYDEGSQASVVFSIKHYLNPLLKGEDPRNIGKIHFMMDRAIKGERYAKSAIDFALYDLTAQYYNIPVYQLLGGNNQSVQVAAVFSASNLEQLKEEAILKKKSGYQVFKLKVGTEHQADLARIKAVREAVGYDVDLRLDGNEAWSAKEGLKKIVDFEAYSPVHIEQPVPYWDLKGLKMLREMSTTPIVIDESILTPHDAFRVISQVGGDILNIKTTRSGGLFPSLKIAAIAESAGVTPLLGSMLELGIGTIANAHFGAALTGSGLATELVGPQFILKDILKQDLKYQEGHLLLPEGPGWGVELDEEVMKEYKTMNIF